MFEEVLDEERLDTFINNEENLESVDSKEDIKIDSEEICIDENEEDMERDTEIFS